MPRSIAITGAGSGIGRACARAFLAAGWGVALLGRRRATLEEAAEGHAAALVLPCDVTRLPDVETAFGRAVAAFGRLDVLFNNAGVFPPGAPVDEVDPADWAAGVAVNLTGAFNCARTAFGQMRRQCPQGGRIINNGSIAAHAPRPGSVVYTTTKHAITGLTRTLALDGRPFGIAAAQIDIGNADTAMVAGVARGALQADGSVRPEPVMDVAEVARTVLHMASLSEGANMPFVTIMATDMPWLGRG